jgi:hypothetical protein
MRLARGMISFRSSGLFVLATALLLSVSGCGVSKGDLNGKVTSKDKAVVVGSVNYIASDGSTASALIQEDGTYSFTNVPAGLLKIGVISQDPSTVQEKKGKPGMIGGGTKPTKNPNWFAIPKKYEDTENSGLTITIDKPVNTYDIKVD